MDPIHMIPIEMESEAANCWFLTESIISIYFIYFGPAANSTNVPGQRSKRCKSWLGKARWTSACVWDLGVLHATIMKQCNGIHVGYDIMIGHEVLVMKTHEIQGTNLCAIFFLVCFNTKPETMWWCPSELQKLFFGHHTQGVHPYHSWGGTLRWSWPGGFPCVSPHEPWIFSIDP